MYKTIIYSTNLEMLKKMYNLIFSEKTNFCINVTRIASSYEELSALNEKFTFNMIIIFESDLKDERILSIVKNIKSKIIFTKNVSNFKNTKCYLYLNPDDVSKNTYDKLKSFLSKIDERTAKIKVSRILESLSFNLKLNGSIYLMESIVYSYMHKDEYLFENLEQNIFPHLAKTFNTTATSAKWAMIRSINYAKFGASDKLKNFDDKFTPKSIITEIVSRI